MTARAWVHLCARQRTNSKPRTSFFLFLQTTCLSVCYNNSTTKKVMSHSQSGVLHNAPWLHSAPNRNSSTLSARWALSSQPSAGLSEHLEENCLGKRSDIFSCAANLVLRLTATVSVKHLGLLKAYKRFTIWGRVACEYQKKTFSFDTPSCLILSMIVLLSLTSLQPQTDSQAGTSVDSQNNFAVQCWNWFL